MINGLRAHLAETWDCSRASTRGAQQSLAIIADEGDERAPIDARANLIQLAAQLQALQTVIGSIEKRLVVQHRANVASKRLDGMRLRRCVEELQG